MEGEVIAGRYIIREHIGKGGFGDVYQALDKGTHNIVALKKLNSNPNSMNMETHSDKLKKRTSNYIVKYDDLVEDKGSLWIVMEYCKHGSLQDYITGEKHLTEPELRDVTSCCLLGLKYLHSCKIIHKDIKPANLLISQNGLIKVGDFGLAEQLNHSNSVRSGVIGTLWYMAPEVFDGKTHMKSDVWSLGISLIEMAEGNNPYQSYEEVAQITKAICLNDPPSLTSSVWSGAFVGFVKSCLVKDVNERASISVLMEHPFVKDSLDRLNKRKESSTIMALVNRVHSFKQENNPSSKVNLIIDTVINPVYNSEQSSLRERNPEVAFPLNEGECRSSSYHAPSHFADGIRITSKEKDGDPLVERGDEIMLIDEYISAYKSAYPNGKVRNRGVFYERKEGGWQLKKGTHFLEDGGYYRVENSKALPEVYKRDGFCWYEGDHENGVPNGQGKEYRSVKGKRVLLFQGTFKDGKKESGYQLVDSGLFYSCEYRDGESLPSGWNDDTRKGIDSLIEFKLISKCSINIRELPFVELYRQESQDSRLIHVFTGYVTREWKYALGIVYNSDDKSSLLFKGFFDRDGKYDEYGTFYMNGSDSFTGTFEHGVPIVGELTRNSTLYLGEVNGKYRKEGNGVSYYPVRNNSDKRQVKYEGSFANDTPCGFGKLFAKGTTERGQLEYCGYFKDGMFNGKGIRVVKDKLVMCWNPRVTLAGLVGCSREEFDQIQSVGEWVDGKPKEGYKFLTNGEPCSVKVENGVVEIENYVNKKGEAISGYGVELKDGNAENAIDLGFMKVMWNGGVSVKRVKRVNGREVTLEKRFRMNNGVQEGNGFFLVNGVEVFKGRCVDCVPNGQGTMTRQNGENATGEWRNGALVKGTIRVYRDGQWRTYKMDSMTSHVQYLGGFGQPISGKGNMTVGTRACVGTFENGEMVMGHEYIQSTTPGMKWNVRCVFAVNGEKATLRYSVRDNSEKVYDSLVYGSCSIVNKGNGIVEVAFENEGEKVTQSFQCSQQQLERVFSEESITVDKRFPDAQLIERKTERGEGNITSHYYYWNRQIIDCLNGLVYDAASRVVYQGEMAMSVEGGLTVPVRNGRGKEYDGNEGLLYDGEWLNGKKSGQGVEYVNGKKVYEGWWSNGVRNGEGTEYAGDVAWTGVWKNGKKDGTHVSKNGDDMIEEVWSNGKKLVALESRSGEQVDVYYVGNSMVIYNDGIRYYQYFAKQKRMIVELMNGCILYQGSVMENDPYWEETPKYDHSGWLFIPDGYGEEYDENGDLMYRGQYKHGYRYYHGEEYVNGVKVFEGEFEFDERNGEGIKFYGECQLKGWWTNGRRDGEFVMKNKNGLVFKRNYEDRCIDDEWNVYDLNNQLYKGSLENFLPENGFYYVNLLCGLFLVPTGVVSEREILDIGDITAGYFGHFAVENDFYCIVKGEGELYYDGKEYAGVFNTDSYIADCVVKSEGKEVFFGIVRDLQFYAGFRYTDYCVEEGLFDDGFLTDGYKLLNGILYSVGYPSLYEDAYLREFMTFRRIRQTIKP